MKGDLGGVMDMLCGPPPAKPNPPGVPEPPPAAVTPGTDLPKGAPPNGELPKGGVDGPAGEAGAPNPALLPTPPKGELGAEEPNGAPDAAGGVEPKPP